MKKENKVKVLVGEKKAGEKVKRNKKQWKSKFFLFILGVATGFTLYPLTKTQIQTAKPHLNHIYGIGLEKSALILDESYEYLTNVRKSLKEKLIHKKEEIKKETQKIKEDFKFPLS